MSNTGAPQGTVLPPFLFTTYTADFKEWTEDECRDLVESFVRWCRENHLQLNVTKTKEVVVDFSKSNSPPCPVCISGKDVEIVPAYKFLGVQLDNKLEWTTNTDAEGHEKTISSSDSVCWGAGIKAKDANRLNKLIKKAESVVGSKLANMDELVRDRVSKVRTIMDNSSHPLHNTVDKLRSSFSNRLLQPRCSKK
ncbi:hypothetical protein D4764_04G0012480, partial [Takifugu flavidus]